jgi:predicted RNase H-like HicB family nuclease
MKSVKKAAFNLEARFTRKSNGLWVASFADLPGVTATARTRKQAQADAETLALRVLIDRMAQSGKRC